MARALPLSERAGLVVGLCPDPTVYERLAFVADERGLAGSTIRAAGSGSTLRKLDEHGSLKHDRKLANWVRGLHRLDRLEASALLDEVGDDPLLEAGISCLARMPAGGAPWQGSWRSDSLSDVVEALTKGGVILVVEARTLEEQRDWARVLLRSGCAFVQTHDGPARLEARA